MLEVTTVNKTDLIPKDTNCRHIVNEVGNTGMCQPIKIQNGKGKGWRTGALGGSAPVKKGDLQAAQQGVISWKSLYLGYALICFVAWGCGDRYHLPVPSPSSWWEEVRKAFPGAKKSGWEQERWAHVLMMEQHVRMAETGQGTAPRPYTASSFIAFCLLKDENDLQRPRTEDLGIYSCDVTDTDGIASSYLIDEEGRSKSVHSWVDSCFDFSVVLQD